MMLIPVPKWRACTKCEAVRPRTTEFWFKAESSREGLNTRCKTCHSNRVKARTDLREWGSATIREEITALCGEGCAICGRAETGKRLAVDHDHATGAVRGLLCANCNQGIGLLRDDIDLIKAAIEYLADPPADKLNYYAQ